MAPPRPKALSFSPTGDGAPAQSPPMLRTVDARDGAPAPGPTPTRPPRPQRAGGALYAAAGLASLVWMGGLAAVIYADQTRGGRFGLDASAIAALTLIALAPLGLVWAGAYALVQARVLAGEARRARRLADELVGPTALAAAEAGAAAEAMRGQIAAACEVASQARDHLGALREALALETERLAEATARTAKTAVGLAETLGRERGELNTLALTLDARSAAVTEAINRQASMVAEASDLAETQLREAEAALAARAADLAAAAGEATDASRIAAEDLGRQVGRLETASAGVGDQMRSLEDGLTGQRAALVTVAHGLRAEQEDFAILAENRTAQLAAFIAGAKDDVAALAEASGVGARALSELIAEARTRFHELAGAAAAERDAFARSSEGALASLSETGARERAHLEAAMRSTNEALSAAAIEARQAADAHAEAARARVDLLNEAAFTAGQKADQVFEARLAEARGLIEQSARLMEAAGERAAAKLEAQVETARTALGDLGALMTDVTRRAASLPQETGAAADGVKAAVEKGLDGLLAAARHAADETQAIDAAFQERVQRNYEMLSEAVQLMGVVAQGGKGASVLQRSSPAERARSRVAAAEAATQPAETAAPAPDLESAAQLSPASPPARGRIRLTPTATDAEFKAAFDAAGGQDRQDQGVEESGWTWKELLTTLDGAAAGQDAELGELLFAEIKAMGIDPLALLPKGRIEEIAAAIQSGDGGGRAVVRSLAPAAIRRIARRLVADGAFRTRAQALVRRYAELTAEAAAKDSRGFESGALLASNAGRAYLLIEGASGHDQ